VMIYFWKKIIFNCAFFFFFSPGSSSISAPPTNANNSNSFNNNGSSYNNGGVANNSNMHSNNNNSSSSGFAELTLKVKLNDSKGSVVTHKISHKDKHNMQIGALLKEILRNNNESQNRPGNRESSSEFSSSGIFWEEKAEWLDEARIIAEYSGLTSGQFFSVRPKPEVGVFGVEIYELHKSIDLRVEGVEGGLEIPTVLMSLKDALTAGDGVKCKTLFRSPKVGDSAAVDLKKNLLESFYRLNMFLPLYPPLSTDPVLLSNLIKVSNFFEGKKTK
jgi:hypothetical protein